MKIELWYPSQFCCCPLCPFYSCIAIEESFQGWVDIVTMIVWWRCTKIKIIACTCLHLLCGWGLHVDTNSYVRISLAKLLFTQKSLIYLSTRTLNTVLMPWTMATSTPPTPNIQRRLAACATLYTLWVHMCPHFVSKSQNSRHGVVIFNRICAPSLPDDV